MELNKNISVWRGNNTPPTDYHLWEKEDGSLHTKINKEWLLLTSPSDKSTLDRIELITDKLNKLLIEEVLASGDDVLRSYLLKADGDSFGVVIDIPKDKALKDIQLGYDNAFVDPSSGVIHIGTPYAGETDPQYMIYSMAVSDGTFTMVKVDLSKFISEKEYSDGLEVYGSKLKVKKDSASESYLSVSSDGVKISGIDSKFDTVDGKLSEINKVLYNQHSQVSLSGSPTTIEKGVSTKINLSWKYVYNGVETTPTSMELKSGNTVLESVNKTYTDTINASKSYQVTAVNEGITKTSNTVTVNAYYPMYFGEGPETFDRTSIVTATNKRPIASNPRGDVSITFTGGQYLWLCIPNDMTINKVTASGFAVPMEESVSQTVNETYKCYRSVDIINAGTVNFTIS